MTMQQDVPTLPTARHESPLTRRLIIAVVLFSSVITLGLTLVQLAFDYKTGLGKLHDNLNMIEQAQVPPLVHGVWAFDEVQIDSQLAGIVNLSDIRYAAISVNGIVKWHKGSQNADNVVDRSYPLVTHYRGQITEIGILHVQATLDGLYRELTGKVFLILMSNGIKTFLVAGFLVFFVHRIIGKHLQKITLFSRNAAKEEELILDRNGTKPDELDHLVESLNVMRARIRESYNLMLASEERFRQAFENAPHGIALVSLDGYWIKTNAAARKILGISQESLLGMTTQALTLPPDYKLEKPMLDDLINDRIEEYEIDKRFLGPRGEIVKVHVNASKTRLADERSSVVVLHFQDMTQAEEHDRLVTLQSTAIHAAATGIFITDLSGIIEWSNPAFSKITGYSPQELTGMSPRILNSGHHPKGYYRDLWSTVITGNVWRREITNKRKDGTLYIANQTISPLLDSQRNVTHFVAVQEDVTEQKKAEERFLYMAEHDDLTGLVNRPKLLESIDTARALSDRTGTAIALLYFDIDAFKDINDVFGHDLGDLVIVEVARRLKRMTRVSDTLARLGGDEFAILQTGLHTPQSAADLARKIIDEMRHPMLIEGKEIIVSASIGISAYPADSGDGAQLLNKADMAMYKAKDKGRNTFHFFSPEMESQVRQRLDIAQKLRRALNENEFSLVYQPQVDLHSGRANAAEALLRWNDPDTGEPISPLTFIPIAEETGLILPIGDWVLRAACRQAAQWVEQGLDGFQRIAVNISAMQFQSPGFLDNVRAILKETGLSPEVLEMELTESLFIEDSDALLKAMDELRAMGVSLSVDDFGTGYASLAYLKTFPINRLKIDRSFIEESAGNDQDAAIVRGIVGLGGALGLNVIAEGVETAEQAAFLKSCGCDETQGFFYARPMSAEQITMAFPSKAA